MPRKVTLPRSGNTGDFVPEQAEPQPACQGVLFQHHQHPLGGNAARQFVPADVAVVFPASTLSSEGAQFFYRKNGYLDCGSLLLPGEPLEIILLKELA